MCQIRVDRMSYKIPAQDQPKITATNSIIFAHPGLLGPLCYSQLWFQAGFIASEKWFRPDARRGLVRPQSWLVVAGYPCCEAIQRGDQARAFRYIAAALSRKAGFNRSLEELGDYSNG